MGTSTAQKAPIAKLGETGIYILVDLGRMALFLLKTLRGIFRRPFRFSELVKQVNFIGTGSILVIFFTAASTGMVLGLQGYYSLHKFGAEGLLGSAVSLTLIMELGPVLDRPHGCRPCRFSHLCGNWYHENLGTD